MNSTIKVLQNLIRLLVVVQVLLGIAIWAGQAGGTASAHTGLGLLFVIASWALAAVAGGAGAPRGMVFVVFVWGIITIGFGYAQVNLMVGPSHWVVQIAHLLIGLGLAWQDERIVKALKARRM
jgi:hypothetical protein